jgi:hypothetical protein
LLLGLGRCGGRFGHDGFELDRGQAAQGQLSATAVIADLDPAHDPLTQLLTGCPDALVEDVLLQQSEERFHRGIVADGTATTDRADQSGAARGQHEPS